MRVPSANTNKNTTRIDLGYLTVWLSYNTMVAFRWTGRELCVSENRWSSTTGKLLTQLEPDKKLRLDHNAFQNAWNAGPADPIINLALAALNGDNIALDAIRDTIKG